jgi:hypothetical protein
MTRIVNDVSVENAVRADGPVDANDVLCRDDAVRVDIAVRFDSVTPRRSTLFATVLVASVLTFAAPAAAMQSAEARAPLTRDTISVGPSSSEAELPAKRWSVGLEASWLGVPRGHLGANVGGTDGYDLAGALVARFQPFSFDAIDAGLGIPHAAMGAGGWLTFELFGTLLANRQRTLSLESFVQFGPQLGYAGPDYFARRSGDFVGYAYARGGPLAFALRSPFGVRLNWAGGLLDSYAQVVPIFALTPAAEVLYDLALGTRVHF